LQGTHGLFTLYIQHAHFVITLHYTVTMYISPGKLLNLFICH